MMVAVLVAAAMAVSFFLPWVGFLGEDMSPMSVLSEQIDPRDLPWRGWLFVASFALAALAAVLVVLRSPAGLVMVIAGGIPYGLFAETALGVRGQVQDLGLPLPQGGDPVQVLRQMGDFIEVGLPLYFITAAALVGMGLVRVLRGL